MATYGSTYGDPTLSTGGAHETDAGTETQSAVKEKASATAEATRDAAAQTAGTAREQASAVTQTAKEKGSEVAQTAKEQASNVVGEAKQQATNVLGEVRTQVNSQAQTQLGRATEMLRSIGDECRAMADGTSDGSGTGVATSVARQLSSGAESLAGYLEGREPTDLLDDVRRYARRSPGTFLLGAVVAGVVAGRLFKGASNADNSSDQGQVPGYGSPALPAVGGFETYDSPAPHGDPTFALPDTSAYSSHGQEAAGTRSPSTGPLAESTYAGSGLEGTESWTGRSEQ